MLPCLLEEYGLPRIDSVGCGTRWFRVLEILGGDLYIVREVSLIRCSRARLVSWCLMYGLALEMKRLQYINAINAQVVYITDCIFKFECAGRTSSASSPKPCVLSHFLCARITFPTLRGYESQYIAG